MSFFDKHTNRAAKMRWMFAAWFACTVIALAPASSALAQFGGGQGGTGFNTFSRVVGGVDVDPNGILNEQPTQLSDDLARQLADALNGTSADLKRAGLRMISLRGLEAALAQAAQSGKPLPAEVQYMAGLQRIEYVILSPETKDIILAGPGESFVADEQGNIVGEKSRMPVIHLQDFLVAMRNVNNARSGNGITVSIDPTEQGIKRYSKVIARARGFSRQLAAQLEEAMGPNQVTLTGVPTDSRYARILVSADYKMKRLSMGLENAPDYLPSLLAMAQQRDAQFRKMAPRFWMECSYQPIGVSEDGHVWQLRGQGVKAMTEESYFDRDGSRHQKGKANKLAQAWADQMNQNFDRLSRDEPVFRELRNLMDLTVVAALIERDAMADQVDLDLSAIKGSEMVSVPTYAVPREVPARCSFVKLSRSWLVTASGGVDVNAFGVLDKTEPQPKLNEIAKLASQRTADRWWWNAE